MSSNISNLDSKAEFSVRIVVCDHYLTKPVPGIDVIYSEFRGADIKQVPVLRIFGPSSDGHKACLHIHGVFPYFYIPCPTSNPEPQFLYQIAASLDKALNIAMKQATSMNQHIYKISLVKGLPFYGFHDKEHLYLKVFLYNPGLIKQAVELCSNGAILGQVFQPHESHLNFTLQFFIDFNLFGMSNVDLQTLKFRRRDGISQSSDEPAGSPLENLRLESVCHYEADCMASHIINRLKIGRGDGVENPGLEEVWNQEMERRKQLNISMASKSLSQGRLKSEETDSHYKFEKLFWIKMSDLMTRPVDVLKERCTDKVQYPAESQANSQLFKAVDVSVHHPNDTTLRELSRQYSDDTLTEDFDSTLVDETVALNSSLSIHHSQVLLDSEDMDFVDLLKNMEDNNIESDSVMGTPANAENESENESDDLEYSQIFNEETFILDQCERRDETESINKFTGSDESLREEANIPQLDGTYDDEHKSTKKVRKRKMRPFQLGLSRPKQKKKQEIKCEEKVNDDSDEINTTQTIVNFNSYNKNLIKVEEGSALNKGTDVCGNQIKEENKHIEHMTVTDLVNKSSNLDKPNVKLKTSEIYDLQNNYEPKASTSTCQLTKAESPYNPDLSLNYSTSPEENDSGIKSFYNTSKILNVTLEYDKEYNSYYRNTKLHVLKRDSFNSTSGLNSKDIKSEIHDPVTLNSSSSISSEENNLGITSFYNTSKLFNITLENTEKEAKENIDGDLKKEAKEFICNTTDNISNDKNDNLENIQAGNVSLINNIVIMTPKIRPPSKKDVVSSLKKYNMLNIRHPQPYYSNYKDVGDKVEIGQIILKLKSKAAQDQKPFENVTSDISIEEWRQLLFLQNNETDGNPTDANSLKSLLAGNRPCVLEPIAKPPSALDVKKWLELKEIKRSQESNVADAINATEITKNLDDLDNSQAIGLEDNEINSSISLESVGKCKSSDETFQVTIQSDGSYLCFGNSSSQNDNAEAPTVEVNFLTVMVLEVHTNVRGDLCPDPSHDSIQAAFLTITNDCPPGHFLTKSTTEIIVVDQSQSTKMFDRCIFNVPVKYVATETELIGKVIESVREHDPDILCAYEIEMKSWGYFVERSLVYGVEIILELSRITEKYRQKRWRSTDVELEGRIIGRVTFNVWRLFRHELALSSYSFENCMHTILKERVPKYSYAQLAEWWNAESRMLRWIPIEHYLTRLSGTVRMLEKLDIINRTSELARLFGLQWWEVLSRGSQFRVESLMLRAARPLNLIALSPTVKQRAAMRAPECLPLIFEPESRFYADPIIVLDFQSLYPSMMIAYNYCFSTCIGRVQNINGESSYEFGAWRLKILKSKMETLVKNGLVHWSPVGVGFVKPAVRRGVLPALLRRILAARQAVKKSMKMQTDESLKKAMHSRQLGLKLIANVTYGYTAANFSGRMPCVEVGDSVVAKGRETLERAIRLVEDSPHWNAKVVYGDTDSMFVLVAGGTRAEAFRVGREIADAVTADNPSPVALKLEKVYQPCILQTKKRYVGYMYESEDQSTPVYEAKGIETVRRDGCPAAVKLLQHCLCEVFSSGDVSRVKGLVQDTLRRLVRGATPTLDLMFTREYHGPNGYRPGAMAPPNEIAKRLTSRDPRSGPRTGERVSWAVACGVGPQPLVQLAREPAQLAREPTPLHVQYYATRALLPPLHRCLSLLGVDVYKWWNEIGYIREVTGAGNAGSGGGIARYLWRERCALCGARSRHSACAGCAAAPRRTVATLAARVHAATSHVRHCHQICSSCCGHAHSQQCINTECPALWRKITAHQQLNHIQDICKQLPEQLRSCADGLDF